MEIKLTKGMMSEWWYQDQAAFRVLMHILLSADDNGEVTFTRKVLAEETGLSEQMVRTAIKKLVATSVLTSASTSTSTNKPKPVAVANACAWRLDSSTATSASTSTSTSGATNSPENGSYLPYIYNNNSLKEEKDNNHILRKEREKEKERENEKKSDTAQEMVDAFHALCPSLKRVTRLTAKRRQKIGSRLKEFSPEEIRRAFENIEASDFATGRTGKWMCSFDWLIDSEAHMTKALEDVYGNRDKVSDLEKAHLDIMKELDEIGGFYERTGYSTNGRTGTDDTGYRQAYRLI